MTRPLATTLIVTAAILALAGILALESTAQEAPLTEASPAEAPADDLYAVDLALREGLISESGPAEPPEGVSRLRSFVSRLGANPGVGLADRAGFTARYDGCRMSFVIAPTQPWGPTGNGPIDQALFEERYYGGSRPPGCWPQGMSAELQYVNRIALENAYAGRCDAIPLVPGQWDGNPNAREKYDLQTTTPRCSRAYRECWRETLPGGTPSDPLVVDGPETWRRYHRELERVGVCETGAIEIGSPLCSTNEERDNGWPLHYDIRWLPESRPWCDPEDPEPPPGPEPPPPGECPKGCLTECPDCPDLPRECSSACLDLADEVEELDDLLATHRDLAPTYMRLPGEDSACVESPDGRFRRDVAWIQAAIQDQRAVVRLLAVECRSQRQCLIPGIPSTGRMEMELLDGGPR